MRIVVASCLALIATSGSASETPTSLNCYVDDWPGWVMHVELNEAAGIVSYDIPVKRKSARAPAIFSPETVKFDAFTISRTDLSLTHENAKLFQDALGVPQYQQGHCELREVKRVF